MTLPVVHHPDYVCELPEDHRFPMEKFGLVNEHLDTLLPEGSFERYEPSRSHREFIRTVHDPNYVEDFRTGNLSKRHLRRIGLPWSEELVERTFRAVDGTIRTIELALDRGMACNTAGGTHHAFEDRGSGFCILNDLAVGACFARDRRNVERILILDLDVHQGNGTASLCSNRESIRTVSVHCEQNYPFEQTHGDHDRPVPAGIGDDEYLRILNEELSELLRGPSPDLVLYDAGVDVHQQDRLGKLNVTDTGLARRDYRVLKQFRDQSIPVACLIGGGYDEDVERLARRHALLHHSALKVLKGEAPEGMFTPD